MMTIPVKKYDRVLDQFHCIAIIQPNSHFNATFHYQKGDKLSPMGSMQDHKSHVLVGLWEVGNPCILAAHSMHISNHMAHTRMCQFMRRC